MNSRNIPSTKDKDVQHQWTRIIAICAIVTIAVSLIIALFVYVFQFIPQEKRAEVRFSLVQTASMLDRAQDFVEKNPFTFEQDEAIDEAGELFRDGWTFYDDEQ